MDDAELLESWRNGDQEAGSVLFDRYYPSVARFFRNKVAADSGDLIQSTFLSCFEGLARMHTANFRSYLFAIACNLLRKHYRAKGRAKIDFGTVSAHDLDPSPSAVIAHDQRQRLLLEALRRIPLDLQIVIELHYWESMTAAEIGGVLDLPLGTVKTRIRRARQLLHEQIVEEKALPDLAECTVEDLDGWARSLRAQATH